MSAQRRTTPAIPMWIAAEASTTPSSQSSPVSARAGVQSGKLPLPDVVPGKTVSV